MTLNHLARRSTRDVDAIVMGDVLEVAREIADERGLHRDWLNGGGNVYAMQARRYGNSDALLAHGGVHVSTASAEQLLAMKMARGTKRDMSDLALLFRELQITDPAEAVDIAEEVFDEQGLPERDRTYLEGRQGLEWMARDVLSMVHKLAEPGEPAGLVRLNPVMTASRDPRRPTCCLIVAATSQPCFLAAHHRGRCRSR